jgi:shikimate kinase
MRDDVAIVVTLNKVPKRGSWFDIGGGVPAQAKEIRIIGGEKVIFANRDPKAGRHRLKAEERTPSPPH